MLSGCTTVRKVTDMRHNDCFKSAILSVCIGLLTPPLASLSDTQRELNGTVRSYKREDPFANLRNQADFFNYKKSATKAPYMTITGYVGPDKAIALPKAINGIPVTHIDAIAFQARTNLVSVTIPEGVTHIDYAAFRDCTGLTHVAMPESVLVIGPDAFKGCTGLASVTIPSGVTRIGHYAFCGCTALSGISIPSGVGSIEHFTFYGCSGLTSVTIPPSVTNIGVNAFSGCSRLAGITVPDSVIRIEDSAFRGCGGITNAVIGAGVTVIGDWAFHGDAGLTGVMTVPQGVTRIGIGAFSGCEGLAHVSIPCSVTSVAYKAFCGCRALFDVDAASASFSSRDGILFDKKLTRLVAYPGGRTGDYTIPGCVTEIGEWAFTGCTGLTGVTIPGSVTSIGESAFSACSGLTGITIPGSVTHIGSAAFFDCGKLAKLTVAASNPAYSSENEVLFDKGKTSLMQCLNKKAVCYAVPVSVTNIVASAFLGCTNLQAIIADKDSPSFSSSEGVMFDKDRATLIRYPPGKTGSYKIPPGVTSIESTAFYTCQGLTRLTVPSSVTNIGHIAFCGCVNLSNVLFEGNAPHAGQSIFAGAKRATVRYLPDTGGWGKSFGDRPTSVWSP